MLRSTAVIELGEAHCRGPVHWVVSADVRSEYLEALREERPGPVVLSAGGGEDAEVDDRRGQLGMPLAEHFALDLERLLPEDLSLVMVAAPVSQCGEVVGVDRDLVVTR